MALSVRKFEAQAFRSLRAIAYPMSNLDVFVGPNGVGKTNLYRALELLQSAARNTLAHDLAQQGGLASAMWAGPRRRSEAARMRLAAELCEGAPGGSGASVYRYEVEIGFPPREAAAAFETEPQIKAECVSYIGRSKTVRLVDRRGPSVMARAENGRPEQIDIDLLDSETVLGRLEDPARYPELDVVRRTMLQWRFYHGLRTDVASPIRQVCPAVATPTLASDGSDLAAVFATLVHIRQDTVDLDTAIDAAFPGAQLVVPQPGRTASFGMIFPEFPQRMFEPPELSDGTLRFIALNEPEGSLHPDLMEPLAQLVVMAAARTQLWLLTHSNRLADAIEATGVGNVRVVGKRDGATEIAGLKAWGAFTEDEDDEETA